MTDGLTELRAFASCAALVGDDTCIMATLGADTESLVMSAYTVSTESSYRSAYTVAELESLKNATNRHSSWDVFFQDLTESFNENNVTSDMTSSGDLEAHLACKLMGGQLSFTLSPTDSDVEVFLVDEMLQIQQISAHTKEYEQRLVRLGQDEAALSTQLNGLDREFSALQENLNRNIQQRDLSSKRLVELKEKIGDNDQEDKSPWEVVKAHELDPSGCRLHNPLNGATCKDFDKELMKLIKSRFLPLEECIEDSPGNSVIKPYSRAELEEKTKSFAKPQYAQLWTLLDKLDAWDYNMFDVQTAMCGDNYASLPFQPHGGSLFVTFYAIMCKYRFLETFSIDEQLVLNWISVVEAGYHGNPYHNSMHAADVLQITQFIIFKGGLKKRCELSDIQVFAALLSAAIHDFDHPGINNNYHIKTSSYLSNLYNDRSVLENLHVSSIFELMKNPAFDILSSFTDDQRREAREVMIEMVLGTDMGMHGKIVAQLKTKLQERATFLKKDEQILALATALKMADISNCGRPLEIYLKWSSKISDEFYQQGDRERSLGMQCSPFMDRLQPAIAKGQIAFMNYIIIPFFEQLGELLPDIRFAIDHAENNKTYWANNDDS